MIIDASATNLGSAGKTILSSVYDTKQTAPTPTADNSAKLFTASGLKAQLDAKVAPPDPSEGGSSLNVYA